MHTYNRMGGVRALSTLLFLGMFLPVLALAQQLRIVDETTIAIEPTAYRAYYGKLTGEPHVYTFTTTEEMHFTAILAVPDVPEAKTDISATLVDSTPDGFFLTGDGALLEWQRFFDTAGRDSYLAGPALDATLPPGEYRIQVSSAADDAPYVLIVSGEETFSPLEILRRYATVPTIKSEFFGKSAIEAYLTPLLLWPIFAILIVAALIVFVLIVLRRRRATPSVE